MKGRAVVLVLALVGLASSYPSWPEDEFSDLQAEEGPEPEVPQAQMNAFDWAQENPFGLSDLQSESEAPRAEMDAFLETENVPFEFDAEAEGGPYDEDSDFQSNEDPNRYLAAEMSNFDVDGEEAFVQQEAVPWPREEAEAQAEDLIRLQEYVDAHMRQPARDMTEYERARDEFA